jgi:hypothetical protein
MDPASYCDLILPVKLSSFAATLVHKKVFLKWRIENPDQAKKFVIERSVLNGRWLELKTIPSNPSFKEYASIDEEPFTGKSFYRLKIIERNNDAVFSTIRQISLAEDGNFIIYPNPASNKIIITINSSAPAVMKLLDISGRVLTSKTLNDPTTNLELPPLSRGTYFIQIGSTVQKLVIR